MGISNVDRGRSSIFELGARAVALGHLTSYVANSERVDVFQVVGSAVGQSIGLCSETLS